MFLLEFSKLLSDMCDVMSLKSSFTPNGIGHLPMVKEEAYPALLHEALEFSKCRQQVKVSKDKMLEG